MPSKTDKTQAGFKIEDDVPMPASGGGGQKYPFGELAVGQSFAVETDKHGNEMDPNKMRGVAYAYGQRHRKAFTVRKNPIGKGARVWRKPDEEFVPKQEKAAE